MTATATADGPEAAAAGAAVAAATAAAATVAAAAVAAAEMVAAATAAAAASVARAEAATAATASHRPLTGWREPSVLRAQRMASQARVLAAHLISYQSLCIQATGRQATPSAAC
jgi:hypothetical protein